MEQQEIKFEDLRQNFPQMPQELRKMIEDEVQKQVNTVSSKRRKKHMARRTIVAALAAAMLLGTTVCAGIIYRMHSESAGKYAVKTKIEEIALNGEKKDNFTTEQTQEVLDIKDVKMEVSYLPDGMIDVGDGKYSYENALYKGGVSIIFYKMDTGDAQFEMLTKNVKEAESIKVSGYDGVYCALYGGEDGEITFNQRIYVAYTDVHYVMEMYAASDVPREEALKIANGVHLQPLLDGDTQDCVHAYNWSEFLAAQNEEKIVDSSIFSIPKTAMANTHAVGESFAAARADQMEDDRLGLKNVEIKVTNVQVSDELRLLDQSQMDSDGRAALQREVDASGKLLPAKINYIKLGDGINSIDEVVDSREVPQKLVYVTVEYTNTGSEKIDEVLFFGELVKIIEEDGQMKIYKGKASSERAVWDEAVFTGAAGHVEMWYYDVHGGERRNNYITHLKAGETATVHMAWLVPKEELGYLYLDLNTSGGGYEFSDEALELGFVDIRQ